MGKVIRYLTLSEEDIDTIKKYLGLPSVAVEVMSGNRLIMAVLRKLRSELNDGSGVADNGAG